MEINNKWVLSTNGWWEFVSITENEDETYTINYKEVKENETK